MPSKEIKKKSARYGRVLLTPEATFCCGTSGTGKTSYVKFRLSQLALPVVVVNGGDEYKEFKPKHRELTDSFKDLRECSIVIEDFVKHSDKELKSLLKILGFLKRHHACYIFINSYLITSTGASSILALFDNVIFTKSYGIRNSMQVFSNRVPVAGLDENLIDSFLKNSRFRYLKVELKTQKIMFLTDNFLQSLWQQVGKKHDTPGEDAGGAVLPPKRREAEFSGVKSHVKEVFKNFPESDLLFTIFTFICRNVHDMENFLNPRDLTIALRSKKRKVIVSLLDFVLALRDEKKPPDDDVIKLFQYFASRFHFPKCFVKNKRILNMRENK